MSKKLLLLAVSVLAIVLVASALSGCTTTGTPGTGTSTSTGASPTSSGGASTGTSTAPKVVNGPPTVTSHGSTITIAGSQDGTVDPKLMQGGYIVEVMSKDKAEVELEARYSTVHIISTLFPARPDGWHVYNRPEQLTGGEPIKITASSPYVITLTWLPLAGEPAATPKTYTGTGNSVVGPVKLNQGTVTLAGVSGEVVANLYDATTGESIGVQHDLWEVSPGKISPASATEDVPATGSYLIQVRLEDYTDWELTVSQ